MNDWIKLFRYISHWHHESSLGITYETIGCFCEECGDFLDNAYLDKGYHVRTYHEGALWARRVVMVDGRFYFNWRKRESKGR